MKLKPILFVALLVTTVQSFAQQEPATDINNLGKISFLSPGASYELRVAKFQSLYFHTFLHASASFSFFDSGNDHHFYFDPAIGVQYRYYYNAKKSAAKGRVTTNNNLNYVAAMYENIYTKMPVNSDFFIEDKRRSIQKVGALWGLQRNYKSHFSIDLNLGLGCLFSKGTTYDGFTGTYVSKNIVQVTSPGRLTLGFWLAGKK